MLSKPSKVQLFALADCNNFYVSCERAFNPSLEYQPVVVLSNNDGCVVARSNEVKAWDIKIGIPAFQIKHLIARHHIKVFSSNYTLYGDLSRRMMRLLASYCPRIEIYSIDEAFLDLSHVALTEVADYANTITTAIKQGLGLPISIGIAPTKTLAKLANTLAKNYKLTSFTITETNRKDILAATPVREIWGIGKYLATKLQLAGISTALELTEAPSAFIRKKFTVVVERLALELQGIVCAELELPEPKQSIQSSRSFGRAVTELGDLKEAISAYAAQACEKLRQQHSKTSVINVYLQTKDRNYFSASRGFAQPTEDTCLVSTLAREIISSLYRPDLIYKKCGIVLYEISQAHEQQYEIFANTTDQKDNAILMQTVDRINGCLSDAKVWFAAAGMEQTWRMKSNLRSPNYTTRWDEIGLVY